MAQVTVKEVVPPVAPVREVTLVLSEVEARALVEVLSRTGGDPRTTAGRHTEAIYDALVEQGIGEEQEQEGDGGGRPLLVATKVRDSSALYFTRDLKGEVR